METSVSYCAAPIEEGQRLRESVRQQVENIDGPDDDTKRWLIAK